MNTTISHLTKEKDEQIMLSHILDKAEACRKRNIPTHTPFLSPRLQMLAQTLLKGYHDYDHYCFFGGYPEAERKMLFFLPDYETDIIDPINTNCPIWAIQIKLPKEIALTHRDFLGSILGTGISREKVGDILISDFNCTILIQRELQLFLLENMHQVGRAKIQCFPCSLSNITPPIQLTQEITDTVSSLRLDAVCALGFSISRTKASLQITAGNVSLNYKICNKPEQSIKQGDIFSIRGIGKCIVSHIGGQSRKGRTFVCLSRYQ